MRNKQRKNRQYKKIISIIKSCKTIVHVKNCEVILRNFLNLHKDVELHSILRRELKMQILVVTT